MCYNKITLLGTGGLEPPRQFPASSSQSYRACLLHHVPITENWAGCSCQVAAPPQLSKSLKSKSGVLVCQVVNNNLIPVFGYKPIVEEAKQ